MSQSKHHNSPYQNRCLLLFARLNYVIKILRNYVFYWYCHPSKSNSLKFRIQRNNNSIKYSRNVLFDHFKTWINHMTQSRESVTCSVRHVVSIRYLTSRHSTMDRLTSEKKWEKFEVKNFQDLSPLVNSFFWFSISKTTSKTYP